MPPFWILEEYEALQLTTSKGENVDSSDPLLYDEGEYLNSETMETSTRKAVVKFSNDDDIIHSVLGRHELSNFELKQSWYSGAELARITAMNQLTVKLMLFDGKLDEEKHCIRGLEHHLNREKLIRETVRNISINSVLTEQANRRRENRKKRENLKVDSERIADSYRAYTRGSIQEAHDRGLQDEKRAVGNRSDTNLNDCQDVKYFGNYDSVRTTMGSFQLSYDEDDLQYLQNLLDDSAAAPREEHQQAQQRTPKVMIDDDDDDGLKYLRELMDDAGLTPSLQKANVQNPIAQNNGSEKEARQDGRTHQNHRPKPLLSRMSARVRRRRSRRSTIS